MNSPDRNDNALKKRPGRAVWVGLFVMLFASGSLPVDGMSNADPAGYHESYARLLETYVTPAGVRYAAWKANAADVRKLEGVVAGIAAADLSGLSREETLAFYLNAYNAWMLHEVIEAYPVKSVKEIALLFGVFFQKRIVVAGRKMSLNHLEKKIIIREFEDPRIHFALNCASRSCPPLLDKPYAGETLGRQLDGVTRAAVSNNPLTLTIEGGTVRLFEIFKWYKSDFKADGGVRAFINKYRDAPLPGDAEFEYQKYDWSLNSA